MGYFIRIEDIVNVTNHALRSLELTGEDLREVQASCTRLTSMAGFSGQGADAAKAYLAEVHGFLISGLLAAFSEYVQMLCIYGDDMEQCDQSLAAEFREEYLEDLERAYTNDGRRFEDLADRLKDALAPVDDLLAGAGPKNQSQIEEDYATAVAYAAEVREEVGRTEHHHLNELEGIRHLLAELNALMDQAGGGRTFSVAGFTPTSLHHSDLGARLLSQIASMSETQAARGPYLKEVLGRHRQRIKEMADDRALQGGLNVAFSGILIAGGAMAVYASAGAATPVVSVLWGASGAGMLLFGTSDAFEAYQDFFLGVTGDPSTPAVNPVQDWAFHGNKSLYEATEVVVGLVGPSIAAAWARNARIPQRAAPRVDSLHRAVPEGLASDIPAEARAKIAAYERRIQLELDKPASERRDHLIPMWRGWIFNLENYHRYTLREVYLRIPVWDKKKRQWVTQTRRVDSYDPNREIVGRKFIQLARSEADALRAVRDTYRYSPRHDNLVIADVPTTRTLVGQGKLEASDIGRPLRGRLVLEVPAQSEAIPAAALRLAKKMGVTIRDTEGFVYSLEHPRGLNPITKTRRWE